MAAGAVLPEKCDGGSEEERGGGERRRRLGEGEHGWGAVPEESRLEDVQDLPRAL